MSKIKVAFINIEISPQYGTSETVFIGAFDDDEKLKEAIQIHKNKYRDYRPVVNVEEVSLNDIQKNNLCRSTAPNYVNSRILAASKDK